MPTLNPTEFLKVFDVAVVGEGETTMVELVNRFEKGADFSDVKGVVYKEKGKVRFASPRGFWRI